MFGIGHLIGSKMALYILLPVAGIAFLVKGKGFMHDLEQVFWDRPGSVMLILCAALCALASMNDMSAPSVSLEGKNLWLIQSLPHYTLAGTKS